MSLIGFVYYNKKTMDYIYRDPFIYNTDIISYPIDRYYSSFYHSNLIMQAHIEATSTPESDSEDTYPYEDLIEEQEEEQEQTSEQSQQLVLPALPTSELTSIPVDANCSICLNRLVSSNGEQESVSALACQHHYHSTCINQWINQPGSNLSCPLCRSTITL